jgi:hypothetical protein
MPTLLRQGSAEALRTRLTPSSRIGLALYWMAYIGTRLFQWKKTFAARGNEDLATTDIARAARAATYGAIETMLVDIDEVVPGTVDEKDGAVTFAKSANTTDYAVVDEIASRVIRHGGRVLGVRKADNPAGKSLAAILRYSM